MAKIKISWLISGLFTLLIFFCARCIQPRDTASAAAAANRDLSLEI